MYAEKSPAYISKFPEGIFYHCLFTLDIMELVDSKTTQSPWLEAELGKASQLLKSTLISIFILSSGLSGFSGQLLNS